MNPDWKWLIIGILAAYLVIPRVLALTTSKRTAATA